MREVGIKSVDPSQGNLPPQRRTTLIMFLILLISVTALTLRMVLPYLLAVIMGGILALLSQPVYQRLRKRNFTPRTASALITIGVILLIIAPVSLFATKAIQQGITIGQGVAKGGVLISVDL